MREQLRWQRSGAHGTQGESSRETMRRVCERRAVRVNYGTARRRCLLVLREVARRDYRGKWVRAVGVVGVERESRAVSVRGRLAGSMVEFHAPAAR